MTRLSMDCKKSMVKEVSDRLKDKEILIFTSYKGLSAQDLNELRKELRDVSGEYLVVKDSIVKRALAEGQNNRITEFVEGEVGIAIDKKEDPTHISKVLVRFSKDHEVLKIRGGIIKGEIISSENIRELAALPSHEVLLAKLANVLNAPIQGLAGSLHAILSKIVYVLNAVKKKKEALPAQAETKEERLEAKGEKPEETKEEKKEELQAKEKETTQPKKPEETPAEKKQEPKIEDESQKPDGKEEK